MKKCEQGNGGHFKWAAVIIVRFGVAQDPGSARVSRVGDCVSQSRTFSGRSFRRDAETNTRDACATRNSGASRM